MLSLAAEELIFVPKVRCDQLLAENLQLRQTIATLNANAEILRRVNGEQAQQDVMIEQQDAKICQIEAHPQTIIYDKAFNKLQKQTIATLNANAEVLRRTNGEVERQNRE